LAERDGAFSLDLRSLASGTYVVRLAAPGQVLTRRFVLY
jgi:hypothetical protein